MVSFKSSSLNASAQDKPLDNPAHAHRSCYQQNLEMAKLLLEKGSRIDAQSSSGRGGVHYAAMNNNLDLMKFLVEHGANCSILTEENQLPLHFAVENDFSESEEMLRYLLSTGGNDVHLADFEGWTPLLIACGDDRVGTTLCKAYAAIY